MLNRSLHALLTLIFVIHSATGWAADSDWVEGSVAAADGASRDYYNSAGRLPWDNYLGDWQDANGQAQGSTAYATASVADTDTPRPIQWDVTALVQAWVNGTLPHKGFFLRGISGAGNIQFRSKEHGVAVQAPQLEVQTAGGAVATPLVADTHLEPSTYISQGDTDNLRVIMDSNNTLLRFDLGGITPGTVITQATLQLFTHHQYGGSTHHNGVYLCDQGHDLPASDPLMGLAGGFIEDSGVGGHTDVYLYEDFESTTWEDNWTFAEHNIDTVATDATRAFTPLMGKALRIKIVAGSNYGASLGYKFADEAGQEPEEIYFRYYLRFADDWNQTVAGGKMPGISGTYGVAGWGGRPSDGTNGWSARGSYNKTILAPNPLEGRTPLGFYVYHADMTGTYGNVWLWQRDYRGYLANNEWHCVEQYLQMNTLTQNNGVLRAWVDGRLAFEKQDIRFRDVSTLKIEQIWINSYHGGTDVSPYDQHMYIDNVVIARSYIGPRSASILPTPDAGPPDSAPPQPDLQISSDQGGGPPVDISVGPPDAPPHGIEAGPQDLGSGAEGTPSLFDAGADHSIHALDSSSGGGDSQGRELAGGCGCGLGRPDGRGDLAVLLLLLLLFRYAVSGTKQNRLLFRWSQSDKST